VSSGLAAIVLATVPVWLALFARLFLGESLPWLAAVGPGLGFGGLVILTAPTGASVGARPLPFLALPPIGRLQRFDHRRWHGRGQPTSRGLGWHQLGLSDGAATTNGADDSGRGGGRERPPPRQPRRGRGALRTLLRSM